MDFPSPASEQTLPVEPVYVPTLEQSDVREIGGASVDRLTSASLLPLREMIDAARRQQSAIQIDLREAQQALRSETAALAEAKRLHAEHKERLNGQRRASSGFSIANALRS